MDVNTRRLRYFLAVAEFGHFGRAAATLHVSPAALSEQVRKLEDELGVRLLDRNPRGAQLTPVGVEVADRARAVLRETSALTDVVSRHLRRRVGVLRLGFVTMAAGELTPHLVAAFEQRAPGFRIDMVHLDYAHQVEAVLIGEVDAAIVRGPVEPEHLRIVEIAREPRLVMMSAAHPLAGSTALRCADVAGEVRVTTENVPEEWRRWWSLDPGPNGTPPPYGPIIHSFDEQLELAAAGVAVSIVPATAAHVFRREDIAFVPLADAAPTTILLVAQHDAATPQIEALFAAAAVVSGLRLSRT
jgi:DNA-binding transcriptional LysR family regulator